LRSTLRIRADRRREVANQDLQDLWEKTKAAAARRATTPAETEAAMTAVFPLFLVASGGGGGAGDERGGWQPLGEFRRIAVKA